MANYQRFLNQRTALVLPYLGGAAVRAEGRRLRLSEPPKHLGWWRFRAEGRLATPEAPADPPELGHLPSVRGHLVGDRLVTTDGNALPVHLLPEGEPELFAPCTGRRWPSGDLLFESFDFESEAEPAVREALENRLPIADVRGVPASLRAAFGYCLVAEAGRRMHMPAHPREVREHLGALAERGVPEAESLVRRLDTQRRRAEREREQQLRAEHRRLRADALRAERALADRAARERRERINQGGNVPGLLSFPGRGDDPRADRIEDALLDAGAEPLGIRRLEASAWRVDYRFMGERFRTIVHPETLNVIDAGICLSGHDDRLTLESLPSAIREAIQGGLLEMVWRYDDD